MENEKFITVLTATYGYEVAIIRGRLESEGITCFVKDELTVQVNPFYSNAIGGVKLQVKESDLNQAVEILKETGYIKEKDFNESPPLKKYVVEQQNKNAGLNVFCPFCGSEEVVQSKKISYFSFLGLLLALCPAPFFQKRYYCFNCKQEFKQK